MLKRSLKCNSRNIRRGGRWLWLMVISNVRKSFQEVGRIPVRVRYKTGLQLILVRGVGRDWTGLGPVAARAL